MTDNSKTTHLARVCVAWRVSTLTDRWRRAYGRVWDLVIVGTVAALVGCAQPVTAPNDDDQNGDGNGGPANTPPVAAVSANDLACVAIGAPLDGTASMDADGDALTYSWSVTSAPTGSTPTLNGSSTPVASLLADVPGPYTIELQVSDGTDDATATASIIAIGDEIVDDITADTTFTAVCPVYRSDELITVDAKLTIEPGVTFLFTGGQNRRLIINPVGSISAIGTVTDTIRFLSDPAMTGSWEGIEVRSDSLTNALEFVEVAYGGRSASNHNITVNSGARLRVTNSLIRNSGEYGLRVANGGMLSGFSGNTLRDNALAGVHIPAELMGMMDEASTYADGNGADVIEVAGGDVDTPQTWVRTDAPFFVTGIVGLNASVTIDPGARFVFEGGQNRRLMVDDGGSLSAVGTAANTIQFTSDPAVPGTWEGIEVRSNSPDNELTYVDVAYAGRAVGNHNVWVGSGAQLRISNSVIHNSGQFGLRVANGGVLSEFADNTFRDNALAGLQVPSDQIGALDGATTYADGNGADVIEVRGGDVNTPQIWARTDAPYFVTGIVVLRAAVSVDPGATLTFEGGQNRRLIVEDGGSLTAVGTVANMIRFLSDPAVIGTWEGIEVRSNSANNRMDYVEIAYGGRSGAYHNVLVGAGATVTVSNSVIRDSGNWGIYVQSAGQLDESGNSYSNNTSGNVRLP